MDKTKKNIRGFTLLELIIVISITVIITSAIMPIYSGFLVRNQVKTNIWRMMDGINRARFNALTGRDNESWGVHFETNEYVLFKGTTYVAVDPTNEIFTLPSILRLSSINLNGAGNEIIFEKITADTIGYGAVTIEDLKSYETNTISVNEVGRINKE